MYKLEVKLKQHTPLIHFQHDQEGATLRASEVKPKLDKFILTQIGGGNYEKGRAEAKAKGWLVGKGDHPALDYKVRIEADVKCNSGFKSVWMDDSMHDYAPMAETRRGMYLYFGNMNSEKPKKMSFSHTNIDMTIFCMTAKLGEQISKHLSEFFLLHNFGTRQTKGYGSFTVFSINGEETKDATPSNYISYFTSTSKNVFRDIELLHKTLRSGINGPKKYSLYFKSLLFSWAESEGIIWDKKSIKSHFLSEQTKRTVEEKRSHNFTYYSISNRGVVLPSKSDPNSRDEYNHWISPQNTESGIYDLRDYLGLSTNEAWMAYDTGDFVKDDKTNDAKLKINKDRNGCVTGKEYVLKKMSVSKSLNRSFEEIGRFKSPILYKPIEDENNNWRVFVIVDEEFLSLLQQKKVYFKSNMPNTEGFSLEFLPKFSVKKYLEYAFCLGENVKSNFSVNRKQFDPQFSRNPNDIDTYNIIIKMYVELSQHLKI